ncbi:MAG: ROK family protein [Pseudorhodobacter sp.]
MQSAAGEVLTLLRDGGPASRAELARTIGVSAAALSKVTADLTRLGAIREAQSSARDGLGRPPINLMLDREAFLMIGAHIGAGLVELVITDALLGRLAVDVFSFDRDIAIEDLVLQLCVRIEKLIADHALPRARIRGLGVGVPGGVDLDGRLNVFSAFAQWSNIPFADLLEERLALPVFVEHNAASIALAESRFGAGNGCDRALYVYLGSGIGAGIAHAGARKCRSVEIGHIVVDPDGSTCTCGGTGCLETIFSRSALLDMVGAKDRSEKGLIAAAMKTEGWGQCYAVFLSSLSTAITLLEPEIVVLGGYFGSAPDAFFEDLRRDLPRRLMPQQGATLGIMRTSYREQAGAMGAACAGLERFVFSDPFSTRHRRRPGETG